MTRLRNLLVALVGLSYIGLTYVAFQHAEAAFARDEYSASASQTDFTVTFTYLQESHVEVFDNGVQATQSASGDDNYTIVGGSTVRFNTGRESADIIVIQRDTSQSSRLVDYTVPSTLVESDLDTDSQQAFFMSQEAIDAADQALGVLTGGTNWDGESKRLTALATPTAGTDATTKDYVDGLALASDGITTPISVALGGTASATAGAARTALGLEIGTDVQAELAVPSQVEAEAGTATTERVWTAQRVSQAIAALGTELPVGYLGGCGISNNGADGDHDIDIALCEARGADNDENLELTSGITKRLDATWVAGTGNGGLSSSLTAPANDTWYHVHSVNIGGSTDICFDTSVVAANCIADHSATAYRRIGSILTNGSANLITFFHLADAFYWATAVQDIDTTVTGTDGSRNLRTISTPLGVQVIAYVTLHVETNTNGNEGTSILTSPSGTDVAPGITKGAAADVGSIYTFEGVTQTSLGRNWQVLTNTSSQIYERGFSSGTGEGINIITHGWSDNRGK